MHQRTQKYSSVAQLRCNGRLRLLVLTSNSRLKKQHVFNQFSYLFCSIVLVTVLHLMAKFHVSVSVQFDLCAIAQSFPVIFLFSNYYSFECFLFHRLPLLLIIIKKTKFSFLFFSFFGEQSFLSIFFSLFFFFFPLFFFF